jgi:hypothetical protein
MNRNNSPSVPRKERNDFPRHRSGIARLVPLGQQNGSRFLKTTAEAALIADLKHYNLLRPVLLKLRKESPKPD